mmetsp:Transcript_188/g.575  ORF Transcript_188/g.575 Transcript_188/m.575 type:complete len:111 (-) Transcript_188:49-381(-)
MARSQSSILALALVLAALCLLGAAPGFLAPRGPAAAQEVNVRVTAATVAGLVPLAAAQPAMAYDSVVAMLQSWLVGGTVLTLIFAAALVAATANPLTKRRTEVATQIGKK